MATDRTALAQLSFEPSMPDFVAAEWVFTGKAKDNVKQDANCSLCGRKHVRYQYQIRNKLTKHREWAGETCVVGSGMAGFLDGKKVSGEALKTALREARVGMDREHALRALEKVAESNGHPSLFGALKRLRAKGVVSPRQAGAVFYAAAKESIEVAPGLFKISMKTNKHKQQVRDLPDKIFNIVISKIDSGSRKTAIKIRGSSE